MGKPAGNDAARERRRREDDAAVVPLGASDRGAEAVATRPQRQLYQLRRAGADGQRTVRSVFFAAIPRRGGMPRGGTNTRRYTDGYEPNLVVQSLRCRQPALVAQLADRRRAQGTGADAPYLERRGRKRCLLPNAPECAE